MRVEFDEVSRVGLIPGSSTTIRTEPTEVCAVFLIYWSPQLKQMDYQQLMLFMQKLPTGKWRNQEIES